MVVEAYAMERNCHFVDVLVQAKVSRSQNINSKLCASSADYVLTCDKGRGCPPGERERRTLLLLSSPVEITRHCETKCRPPPPRSSSSSTPTPSHGISSHISPQLPPSLTTSFSTPPNHPPHLSTSSSPSSSSFSTPISQANGAMKSSSIRRPLERQH